MDVWTAGADLTPSLHPGPLPALAPLLVARQAWIPHAVVLLDRTGADVEIVQAQDRSSAISVEGATSHITTSNLGGWSQHRFPQQAAAHWHDNAELVAEQLVTEVDRTGLDLVVVSGDRTAFGVLHPPDPAPSDGLGASLRGTDPVQRRGGGQEPGSHSSVSGWNWLQANQNAWWEG